MLRTLVLLLIAAAAFAQTPKTNVQSGKRYPRIVIRGAIVVDGSGTPASGPKDIVIRKQKPSGFFGTNLASYLTLLGCDSVVVVGTTTSGCVRATVVDAFSLNYRVALAEEGCFDRSEASHALSLCDMHAKYADVVPTAEILSYFDRLPAELFDLPTGVGTPAPSIREAAE